MSSVRRNYGRPVSLRSGTCDIVYCMSNPLHINRLQAIGMMTVFIMQAHIHANASNAHARAMTNANLICPRQGNIIEYQNRLTAFMPALSCVPH